MGSQNIVWHDGGIRAGARSRVGAAVPLGINWGILLPPFLVDQALS